jgi:hypothetical protein
MSSVIGWSYLLLGIGGAFDASRYSYDEWRLARRDKNFWLVMLLFFSLLFILPYIFAIRPRLRMARLIPTQRKVGQ